MPQWAQFLNLSHVKTIMFGSETPIFDENPPSKVRN